MISSVTKFLNRVGWRLVLLIAGVAVAMGWFILPTLQPGYASGLERHGDIIHCDLQMLGGFPFDDQTGTIEQIPKVYRDLDGKKVALDGFVFNPHQSGKRSMFQLLYDTGKSGTPLVQQRIFVSAPEQIEVEPTGQQVRAVGTFHVTIEQNEIGRIVKLFSLDLDHLEQL